MSIDWLCDLERAVDGGKEYFACPGPGRNQWMVARKAEELKKSAKRAADSKRMSVSLVRLVNKSEAMPGDLFLVPTSIGQPGPRGEPQVQWTTVETREAAELMRDVRFGPSPFFGMQVVETVTPEEGVALGK